MMGVNEYDVKTTRYFLPCSNTLFLGSERRFYCSESPFCLRTYISCPQNSLSCFYSYAGLRQCRMVSQTMVAFWSHISNGAWKGGILVYRSRMLTKYQTFYLEGLSALEAYRYVFIEISLSLCSLQYPLSGRVFAAASKERIKKLVGVVLCCLGCYLILVNFYMLVHHEFILRGIPPF